MVQQVHSLNSVLKILPKNQRSQKLNLQLKPGSLRLCFLYTFLLALVLVHLQHIMLALQWKHHSESSDQNSFLFFFFSSHFRQLCCHNPFFSLLPSLEFWQLDCHNWFFFPLSSTSPSSTSSIWNSSKGDFGNIITEIQFFSHSNYHIISLSSLILFCQNFWQPCYRNLLLSSICQIILNNTYITNKLDFLQYLAKRLQESGDY